jgi:hypothetical protein
VPTQVAVPLRGSPSREADAVRRLASRPWGGSGGRADAPGSGGARWRKRRNDVDALGSPHRDAEAHHHAGHRNWTSRCRWRRTGQRRTLGGRAARQAELAVDLAGGLTIVVVAMGSFGRGRRRRRMVRRDAVGIVGARPGLMDALHGNGGRGMPHRGTRQDQQRQREQHRDDPPDPAHARRHPCLPAHRDAPIASLRQGTWLALIRLKPPPVPRPGGRPRSNTAALLQPGRHRSLSDVHADLLSGHRCAPTTPRWGFPPLEGQGPEHFFLSTTGQKARP